MLDLAVAKSDNPMRTPLPRAMPAWAYSNAELGRLELERDLLPSW